MPLLRFSLYSQNVNLYLAPTADARDTWLPLMRTIGAESRAIVLSANQCMRRKNLPEWVTGKPPAKSGGQANQASILPRQHIRPPVTVTKTEIGHGLFSQSPQKSGQETRGIEETVNNSSPPTKDRAAEDNGEEEHRPKARRRSTITKLPDKHEMVTPASGDSNTNSAAIDDDDDFVSRGGSCIISPMGEVIEDPLWDVEDGGLLIADVDFEDCERGRLDLDVAGSYSRNDAFKLTVEGLDINPPP